MNYIRDGCPDGQRVYEICNGAGALPLCRCEQAKTFGDAEAQTAIARLSQHRTERRSLRTMGTSCSMHDVSIPKG